MARGDFSGYVLVRPNEDGNPLSFLNEAELKDLLNDPVGSYGITHWLSADELNKQPDPNYWGEGSGLLLNARCATLEPVKTVTKYEVRLSD